MRPRRGYGPTNSIMQVAAAVVGTAAASQVIGMSEDALAVKTYEAMIRVCTADGVLAPEVASSWLVLNGTTPRLDDIEQGMRLLMWRGKVRAENYRYFLRELDDDGSADRPEIDLSQVIAPVDAERDRPADRDAKLGSNAYANTYETRALPGVTEMPDQLDVVGANGRRLIVRWMPEGVWVGGCLITDQEDAERLARFITREADE